ncbi:DUF2510 domain-containing protein [Jiangella ureilytica]|uniref:DUF2510 domain-containing protein n=1 Tax=Jiangella ureilytica TaxID=2530374 RepID=UPI00193C874D|nr:DUF2510 domain-containing protein [Jiangella ureilytica]
MTERRGEPRQPGWYPDAAGNVRWWNGQFWSHTSPSARVGAPEAVPPPEPASTGDGVLLGLAALVTGLIGVALGLYAFVRPVGEIGNGSLFLPVVLGIVAVGLGVGALRRRRLALGVLGIMAGTASFMLTALVIVVLSTWAY